MAKDYLKIAGNVHLKYYIEAADKIGLDWEIVIPRLTAKFTIGDHHWFINNTALPINNGPSGTLSRRKHLAHKIMNDAGIPVPQQLKVESLDELINFYREHKGEIVIKPAQNLGGKGITMLPENEEALPDAYVYAQSKDKYKRVLVEEYLHGDNYRILAVANKVVGVVKRLPADVLGDGKHNIQELIDIENIERKGRGLMAIPVDKETQHKLKGQNMTLESIPENGQQVFVRLNTNLSTGGTTEEVMKDVHPYYIDLALQTLKALDLEFGGIDLITTDITSKVKCGINEVNYNPGLRLHYKVDKGEVTDVAVPIMEYIRDRYTGKTPKI